MHRIILWVAFIKIFYYWQIRYYKYWTSLCIVEPPFSCAVPLAVLNIWNTTFPIPHNAHLIFPSWSPTRQILGIKTARCNLHFVGPTRPLRLSSFHFSLLSCFLFFFGLGVDSETEWYLADARIGTYRWAYLAWSSISFKAIQANRLNRKLTPSLVLATNDIMWPHVTLFRRYPTPV